MTKRAILPQQARAGAALLVAVLGLGFSGCVHSALSARGEIAGQNVQVTVDTPVARYYLEHTLRGETRDPSLDAELAALQRRHIDRLPTTEELREIAQRYSTDFAALYFAHQLSRDPRSRPVLQSFRGHLERLRRAARNETAANRAEYLVAFVPGWDYATTGHFTGADFARPRARLQASGLATRLIEIPSNGSVEQNAAAIAQAIRDIRAPNIILVSASSGGPATALALGKQMEHSETCRVRAWLNIGGLLRGTPLFDPYRAGPRRWLGRVYAWIQGWDWEAFESLGVERSRARFKQLRLPTHLQIVNYVGIPLSGQVSSLARERYFSLREYGPNDGLTLIADALVLDQPTIPAIGLDHFLAEDPELDIKTLALALTLIDALETDATARADDSCGARAGANVNLTGGESHRSK